MRNNYTEVLVEEFLIEEDAKQANVDQAAAKQFYDGLKAIPKPYIDTEAFHKAYDELIKDAGMDDIFNSDGLISGKWLYGRIKECTNTYAASVLKKLWAAQYVDNLKTLEWHKKQKEQEDKRAKEKADYEKREQETLAEYQAKADDIRKEALPKIKQELKDAYKDLTGKDLDDELTIKPKLAYGRYYTDPITLDSYAVHANFATTGYLLRDKNANPDEAARLWTKITEDSMDKLYKQYADERIPKELAGLGLDTIKRWDRAWFLYDNKVYSIGNDTSKLLGRGQYSIYVRAVGEKDGKQIGPKDYPDFSELELIALHVVIRSSSGRCWAESETAIYYNPDTPKTILKECGVTFEEYKDPNGVAGNYSDRSFISEENIPLEVTVLGLTAGEEHSWAYDSSD